MEILIIVSAAIAFGALIAYLWNSSRVLEEKNRLLEIAESRLAAVSGDVGSGLAPAPTGGGERIAELESQLRELARERSELSAQLDLINRKPPSSPEPAQDIQLATTELSQKIASLDAENAALRSRIAELEGERNGTEQKIILLQDEHDKLPALRDRVASLEQERSELAAQLQKAESEKGAHLQRIVELEGLETKLPSLEARVASLSDQNAELLTQISDLQSSIRDKIRNQLDGLQELYRKLDSGTS